MPTGYTAKLCNGEQSFKDFALQCARAFGATIAMRDDPSDNDIPERFEPSTYHKDELDKTEKHLKAIEKMTAKQLDAAAEKEYLKAKSRAENKLLKERETQQRLIAMQDSVSNWQPPTGEHQGLKDFMLEQLETTIKFDGDTSYSERELQSLTKLSGEEWKQKELRAARKRIAYHTKEWGLELERTENRNLWVAELRESLK